MKRWPVRVAAIVFVSAMYGFAAMAARLPTSTLDVHVLSVEQESFNRETPPSGKDLPGGGQTFETTGFVAKVQIRNVISTDHGLAAGQTIDIHYKIRTAKPRPLPVTVKPLKPGEDTNLTVMKGNDGYELR